MKTDNELIKRYVEDGSEGSFKEVVDRHVGLVYGAALRQLCGNESLAREVTQSVFTTLATKAPTLCNTTNVAAWLYSTTRFTVSHSVRTERRRQSREQIAHAMQTTVAEPDTQNDEAIPPELIDEVLDRLNEEDRELVLLRFFEGQSFAVIGATMNATEDAVRMRLARALEKAREVFARSGIKSSAAAVGAVLAKQAIAAPLGLSASISHAALLSTASVATTATSKVGITALVSSAKGTLFVTGTAALVAIGIIGFAYRRAQQTDSALPEERKPTSALVREARPAAKPIANFPSGGGESAPQIRQGADNSLVPSATEAKIADAERMSQMRPLLKAGMPIKGAVVLFVGDKAAQHPVEFIMGKETRINGDDGTYSITPSLNEDGSVKYDLTLGKKEASSGKEQIIRRLSVIDKPWGGFTVYDKGGRVLAFDPDDSSP